MVAARRIMWLALALPFAACGGDGGNSPDAAPPFTPAFHTPYPRLNMHSGKILSAPKLVTITFHNYTDAGNVESFGDFIVTSDWFHTVGNEYGVGNGTHLQKVRLVDNPPPTFGDTDARNLINNNITAGNLPAPGGANAQVLYMIYVPPQTQPGVAGVYGYHDNFTYNGTTTYSYAVIYDFGGPGNLAVTTTTASHELIEASTDPLPSLTGSDGYWLDLNPPDPWALAAGQECADLCDSEAPILAGTFTVQRSWSSANAALGKAPCVPEDSHWEGVSSVPSGIQMLNPGQTATFTLTGWSTVAEADWNIVVTLADNSDLKLTDMSPQLSTATMNNGKTATLKLTAPAGSGGKFGGVYIKSGNQLRYWPVGFLVN